MDSDNKDSNENNDYFIVEDDILNDIINSFKIPEKYDPFDFSKLCNYIFDVPYNHMDLDTTTMDVRKNYQLLNIEL
jgi:hypothetical protein